MKSRGPFLAATFWIAVGAVKLERLYRTSASKDTKGLFGHCHVDAKQSLMRKSRRSSWDRCRILGRRRSRTHGKVRVHLGGGQSDRHRESIIQHLKREEGQG